MWIERDISNSIQNNTDPIQVIRGPRQCGKTSLLLHLDQEFQEVSLDDPSLRELAQNDPELFLRQFDTQKIFIDEAQYAPALFPSLKRMADLYKRENKGKRQTILRITGSNQILMDRSVKESLAGRASFFDMNTLSVAEILRARKTNIQDILYTGGWPELHADKTRDIKKFLDDYINSYVEKDIVLAAGIQKSREFLKFVRLLAGRVGEIIDFSSFANDAGVDGKTIKEWVSVLERMHIIMLVMPFSSNLSSRLIKSPKVYFIDTGIACRLQGWTSAAPILTSPQQGHLFENLVFSEIYKLNINYGLGWQIFHWRSRDGEEIDFVIQKDPGSFIFIEAKISPVQSNQSSKYPEFNKVFHQKKPPLFICHQEGAQILNGNIPLAKLKEFLLNKI
jgi:predicted AAA+ superfamily ATPase